MTVIGRIDINIFKCVTPHITTDEVIITEERIAHIKENHPGDYELIKSFLKEALCDPDYILNDKKEKTGLILKQVEQNGLRFQIVLRLHTSDDPQEFKNSILSAWRISESRWKNYLKSKNILYKKE